MVGRSLILVAALAGMAIVNTAAHSQGVADPSGKTLRQEVDSDGHPITPPPTLPDIPPLLPGRPPAGLPHYPDVTASPGQLK